MDNLTQRIQAFFSALKATFDQRGWSGRVLVPGLFLLAFCFLCSILIGVLSLRNTPGNAPTPNVFPSPVSGATPTALFNFGSVTFTPFPTLPVPSVLPTTTGIPTETTTLTVTPALPTTTATSLPTLTVPPATPTSSAAVLILAVNKAMEYVDLQNVSSAPVDLSGWKLVSETGNQSCTLRGTLAPNDVLRVWAGREKTGFSCRFPINIWNDSQSDPAVLYNAQGQEISRFP